MRVRVRVGVRVRVRARVGRELGEGAGGMGRELGDGLQRSLARLARLLRLLDVGFEQRHEGVVDLTEGRAEGWADEGPGLGQG